MTFPKRLAAVGLAAALVAGPVATLPAPATAATPGYVAIVVDGHTTACVKYTSGITGDAVLNAAAQVHYRNDGLIDAIDDYPSPPHADATHYWSYWHDTSGSWVYSKLGASSYNPKAGTVEGWRFDDGDANPPAPSEAASGLYAKLCGAHDKSVGNGSGGTRSGGTSTGGASKPRTSASVAVKHASGTTGTHKYHPRAHSDPTSTSATASTAPRASRSAAGSSGARTSTAASGGTSSAPDDSSPAASASSSSVAAAPIASVDASPAAESSSGGSSGSLTSVLVGLGLVLVLGGGAAVVVLRRRAGVE